MFVERGSRERQKKNMPTCQCSEGCDRKAENESLLRTRTHTHSLTSITRRPSLPPPVLVGVGVRN